MSWSSNSMSPMSAVSSSARGTAAAPGASRPRLRPREVVSGLLRRTSGRLGGSGGGREGRAVGTEATALRHVRQNARNFGYPAGGFASKIEYSLVYAMVSEMERRIYPEEAVVEQIEDERWDAYMEVHDEAAGLDGPGGRVSYAQLSAILALAAEKVPPRDEKADADGGGDSDRDDERRRQHQQDHDQNHDHDHDQNQNQNQNQKQQERERERRRAAGLSQTLCKSIFRSVVRHAEANGLDRESELADLLDPVRRHSLRRGGRAALRQILPFYVGYAASLVTLNPLPMIAGLGLTHVIEATDGSRDEERNVAMMRNVGERMGDMERVGLLDEADDDS